MREPNIQAPISVLFRDEYDDEKFIGETNEYIVANGGDGTLLRAIYMYSNKDKPFYGRAGGSVNFLMNTEEVPVDDYQIITFHKLKVEVFSYEMRRDMSSLYDDKKVETKATYQAFNDIALGGSNGMNAYIDFNIIEEDDIFGNLKGGGLIISTAQGSTGINKTNHGTILPLSTNQWSVTGDKTTRPVASVIEPREISITPTSREGVILWVDGDKAVVHNVTKVIVSEGDKVEVIFNDYDGFKKKRRAQF